MRRPICLQLCHVLVLSVLGGDAAKWPWNFSVDVARRKLLLCLSKSQRVKNQYTNPKLICMLTRNSIGFSSQVLKKLASMWFAQKPWQVNNLIDLHLLAALHRTNPSWHCFANLTAHIGMACQFDTYTQALTEGIKCKKGRKFDCKKVMLILTDRNWLAVCISCCICNFCTLWKTF